MQTVTTSVKTWKEVRHYIQNLQPKIYSLIKNLPEMSQIPFIAAEYPYGSIIADKNGFNVPNCEHLLSNNGHDLNAPLTLLLDKQLEFCFDTGHGHSPWKVLYPGDFFPVTQPNELQSKRRFYPKSIFDVYAGVRDIINLKFRAANEEYHRLIETYGISQLVRAENPLDHFHLVKKICEEENINWRAKVLIFTKEWEFNLKNNPAWLEIKNHLLCESLRANTCKRSIIYRDIALDDIATSMNFRFKGFGNQAVKNILMIATNELPGYRPVVDNQSFPLSEIEHVIRHNTKGMTLAQYIHPIFMKASMLDEPSQNLYDQTIYYSFTSNQYPVLLGKGSNDYRTTMNEVKKYFNTYLSGLREHVLSSGTVYSELKENLDYMFYSQMGTSDKGFTKVSEVYQFDKNFNKLYNKNLSHVMPTKSPFLKGLIGLHMKTKKQEEKSHNEK